MKSDRIENVLTYSIIQTDEWKNKAILYNGIYIYQMLILSDKLRKSEVCKRSIDYI